MRAVKREVQDTALSRILCVSPLFVPEADPEAFCGAKLCLALLEQGVDLTVLHLRRDGVQLDQSPLWDPLREHAVGIPPAPGPPGASSILLGVRYRTNCWSRWIHVVVQTARKLHLRRRFTCVYSRSLPMWSHIAGYWIARSIGVPWIVNINDPWDLHLNPSFQRPVGPLYSACSWYWMRRTLRFADVVTYPCERLGQYMAGLSGIDPPYSVIRHAGPPVRPDSASDGRFRIVHAGRLASEPTGRRTHTVLDALSEFLQTNAGARRDTQLVLVGPDDSAIRDDAKKLGLEQVVTATGRLSYAESLQWISRASVCLLIEGDMREGIYLPSKVADYITCRKPVLALSPRIGTVADLAEDKGILRVDPSDVRGLQACFARLHYLHNTRALDAVAPSAQLVSSFDPAGVSRRFVDLLSHGSTSAGRV